MVKKSQNLVNIEGEQKKVYYRFVGWRQHLRPECFKSVKISCLLLTSPPFKENLIIDNLF